MPFESELLSELQSIAGAVSIATLESFTFADLPEVVVPQTEVNEADGSQRVGRQALVETLADMLYWNCYVQRFEAQPARPLDDLEIVHDSNFLAELSEANQSTSHWSPGWRVVQTASEGQIQVRRGECHRAPVPGEFLFDAGPGMRVQHGDTVSVRVVRESTIVQRGFYFCFSDEIPDQFEEFNSVRVYFNLRPEGAPVLLRELTGRLNRFLVPFRFKCPVSPNLFNRLDSGVLYVPWRFWDAARHCVADSLPQFETFLEDDVPLFTKQVKPGVGLAEDPGNLRSFGQTRCELVAEGLVDSWLAGKLESSGQVASDTIVGRFQQAGISFDRPWLNPGSRDWLELPAARRLTIEAKSDLNVDAPKSSSGDGRFLEAADRIGSRICRDAIWSGPLCNWLEWESEPIGGIWSPVYRAFGAAPVFECGGLSLYGGVSGIAFFLAKLSEFSGDPCHRETALAAARQVLQQVQKLSGRSEFGFYTGWPGAMWAVVEVGICLGEESLVEAGLAELEKLSEVQPAIPDTDLINGSAGLIVGLIDLGLRFQRISLIDVAVRHGEFLLDVAEESERGASWKTLGVPVRQNLTGFGHGVSGIICALAELYRVTGDDRFSSVVDEGVRYESSYFSEEFGNWEDHRTDAAPEGQSAFQFGWCHGAPGVAFARLRLLELGFDSELIRRDLRVAAKTTLAKLFYADIDGQRDFGLCHGLTGNCELPMLLSECSMAATWLNDGLRSEGRLNRKLRTHVNEVATSGIQLFGETGIPWPTNLALPGETPSLFNGMSGIGYFYLRAFAPTEVPSVLLFRPDHKSR
jgi:lantibiotic biosynthesis protein